MPTPLPDADSKMRWAKMHLEEFNRILQEWRDTQGQTDVLENNVERCFLSFYLGGAPTPPELALLAGDALHAMHSSLDHVAWSLSRLHAASGARLAHDATFPIFKNRGRFWRRSKNAAAPAAWFGPKTGARNLLSMPTDARQMVVDLQPYKSGNFAESHPLWLLHALSNEDKHKALHVVHSAILSQRYQITYRQDVEVTSYKPFPGRVLDRKQEVARLHYVITGPKPELEFQPEVLISEVFGQGSAKPGLQVVETLATIYEYVINEAFRSGFDPYFARG